MVSIESALVILFLKLFFENTKYFSVFIIIMIFFFSIISWFVCKGKDFIGFYYLLFIIFSLKLKIENVCSFSLVRLLISDWSYSAKYQTCVFLRVEVMAL